MKHSNSFILGAMCFAMISLNGMSSCAKSANDQQQASHSLEIWETYEAKDLASVMYAINESTMEMEHPLYEILSGMDYAYGPVVGKAFYRDTTAINAILSAEAVKALLPNDLRLTWFAYPESERSGLYRLIALKANDGQAAMHGDLVKEAKAEIEPQCGEIFASVLFNEQGTELLANLTEANIGKDIAMVVEGKVYFYATVQAKNAAGTLMFPLMMDEEEAEAFVQKIK